MQHHGGNYSSGSSKRPESANSPDDDDLGRASPGSPTSGPLSPGAESLDSDSSISLMGPPSPVSSSSHNGEARSASPESGGPNGGPNVTVSVGGVTSTSLSSVKSFADRAALANHHVISDLISATSTPNHHAAHGLGLTSSLVPPPSAFTFGHAHHPSLGECLIGQFRPLLRPINLNKLCK